MLPIWDLKYGEGWRVVDRTKVPVVDMETKKITTLEAVAMEHTEMGVNRNTKDRCQIMLESVDNRLQHHDPLGGFHSRLTLKRVSTGF
jgi:hypothetical protein